MTLICSEFNCRCDLDLTYFSSSPNTWANHLSQNENFKNRNYRFSLKTLLLRKCGKDFIGNSSNEPSNQRDRERGGEKTIAVKEKKDFPMGEMKQMEANKLLSIIFERICRAQQTGPGLQYKRNLKTMNRSIVISDGHQEASGIGEK